MNTYLMSATSTLVVTKVPFGGMSHQLVVGMSQQLSVVSLSTVCILLLLHKKN